MVRRYSRVVDPESAYELLERRISDSERERKDAEERKAREKEAERYGRTTTTRRRSTVSPVVKVLTSATFIRGVMGVLTKVIRK
jgi:hypothetical protein